jgi:hypothetical protein
VVPADNKWFTQLGVAAAAVVDAIAALKLHYPKLSPGRRRELVAARRRLAAE